LLFPVSFSVSLPPLPTSLFSLHPLFFPLFHNLSSSLQVHFFFVLLLWSKLLYFLRVVC
jgi:hypothetical protein